MGRFGFEAGFLGCVNGKSTVSYERDGDDFYIQVGRYLLVISKVRHGQQKLTQDHPTHRGVQEARPRNASADDTGVPLHRATSDEG